jgi:hypothetical protein
MVDGSAWRLELAGAVEDKKSWTREALYWEDGGYNWFSGL